jgi:hypothetical protein
MLLAIDRGSSHGEGYSLAEKTAENCMNVLVHYHVMAEHQNRKALKVICTNKGKEWVNQLMVTARNSALSRKEQLLTHHLQTVFLNAATEPSLTGSKPSSMMPNSLGHTGLKLLQWSCTFATSSQAPTTWVPFPTSCGTRRNQISCTSKHLAVLCMQESPRTLS